MMTFLYMSLTAMTVVLFPFTALLVGPMALLYLLK